MSADPLSITGGAGPIVPASLVNTQAQSSAAKTQAAADTMGARPQNEIARNNIGEQNTAEPNKQATQAANAENEIKSPLEEAEPLAVEDAVETFKQYLDNLPHDLKFAIDEESNRMVFKVVNPITNEVVKQYPTDEFLAMVRRLKEASQSFSDSGFLVDDRF